jgi:hypothetical protein
MAFNLAGNSATSLTNYTNFSVLVANIGVNDAGNLLAGIAIETPNNLRLYDVSTLTTDPLLLDWEFFTPNAAGQATGNADFGNNRLYALNSNNGLLAMQLGWPQLNIAQAGSDVVLNWIGTYTLQASGLVGGPYTNVPAATSPYTTGIGSQLFFRLKFP